ncbi:hypothetical protein V8C86DRAFT_2921541, partial [Haematococcus lacustris]
MRWAILHFLPWYVLSLSRAARASPETFLFCCASVRSGCSASSRSLNVTVRVLRHWPRHGSVFFLSHRKQHRQAITNTMNYRFCL